MSDECVDVLLLFARGSGQNKDHFEITRPFGDEFSKFEKESYAFFNWNAQYFNDRYPNITYKAVSLHDFPGKYDPVGYKAVEVGYNTINKASNTANADASWIPGEYRDSVKHGTAEAIGFLKDQVQKCPDQYYMVGGYSQGAQVMGDALFGLDTSEQAKVLGAGLFGDPKYIGYKDGISMPWRRGEAKNNDHGMLEPRLPYIPSDLERRTVSWCLKKDIVCAGWSAFGKESSHSSYAQQAVSYGVTELAAVAAPQLSALERKRVTGSGEVPATRISKEDRERLRDVVFLVNDNSNADVLSTFKYYLDPELPTFTKKFAGTYYGAAAFSESDSPIISGKNTPFYTHLQDLIPLTGFDPSRPATTSSNLHQPFYKRYAGTPFLYGGGDIPDPYHLGIERAVITSKWRQDPSVERNIVMLVDRPPKGGTYKYDICYYAFRRSIGYPETDGYKNCYADFRRETWSARDFPETCETILMVMTLDTCTSPLTAPALNQYIERSVDDSIKLAQANKVKISIVIPYKIADSRHPMNDPVFLQRIKTFTESTGGIFINYNDREYFSVDRLIDALYQVFTKKQNTLSVAIDGSKNQKLTKLSANKPAIFDVSQSAVIAQSYQWDFDGDGTWDESSPGPVVEHTFSEETTGAMAVVRAMDASDNLIAETQIAYTVAGAPANSPDESSLSVTLPENMHASTDKSGSTLLYWSADEKDQILTVIDPVSKNIIATAPVSDGFLSIPGEYSEVLVRVLGDTSASDPLLIRVRSNKAAITQTVNAVTIVHDDATRQQAAQHTSPVITAATSQSAIPPQVEGIAVGTDKTPAATTAQKASSSAVYLVAFIIMILSAVVFLLRRNSARLFTR